MRRTFKECICAEITGDKPGQPVYEIKLMLSRVSRTLAHTFVALKYDTWWHHFGPTVVDTYAKPPVHYWPRSTYVLNWQNCIGINVRTCPLLRP